MATEKKITIKGIKDKFTSKRKMEINRLYQELDKIDPRKDTQKYYDVLKSIVRLEDIKIRKRINIDWGDIVTGAASLAGIMLILAFEGDGNVIHSKALSFVKK